MRNVFNNRVNLLWIKIMRGKCWQERTQKRKKDIKAKWQMNGHRKNNTTKLSFRLIGKYEEKLLIVRETIQTWTWKAWKEICLNCKDEIMSFSSTHLSHYRPLLSRWMQVRNSFEIERETVSFQSHCQSKQRTQWPILISSSRKYSDSIF